MRLSIPDRFEILERDSKKLESIIVPVEDALEFIDDIYRNITVSGRGAFLLLRGKPGVGKTTFLKTFGMYRENIAIEILGENTDLRDGLKNVVASNAKMRILVIEGREALGDTTTEQLETALHQINSFIRSERGFNTVVVWPCNTDSLQDRIVFLGREIGGTALIAGNRSFYAYPGPPKSKFRQIAKSTIATLNNGASVVDYGIGETEFALIIDNSKTVGDMLGVLRETALKNLESTAELIRTEQCRLWVVVAAGNEPKAEVASLTRGSNSYVDIDRLVGATEANIVNQIKKYPHQIGILANSLDVRIIHLPILTSLSVARTYGKTILHRKMTELKLTTIENKKDAVHRISISDLATAFKDNRQGLNTTGKAGSNTIAAFEMLSKIAENNDRLLNIALAEALKDAGYIISFETEKNFGKGLKRCTDILAKSDIGNVRIELMWRKRISRAGIANYVLTKIWHYGQALGAVD